MKVRLVKRQTIIDFVNKHPRSKVSFSIWLRILKGVDWESTEDIKNVFNSADFIGKSSNRIVFNISGNNYRMICSYYFGEKYVHLYINWIGTHNEYDKICYKNLQYAIENY